MTQHARYLAARMDQVAMSPTMKGMIAAEKLRREGADVVDLGAGEPDFPTPPHICAAGHAAIDAQRTKYTANMCTLELRQAVTARYRADYGVEYAPDEVVITAGGKQALFHAAIGLFGPGDEVITHAPGWPTLVEQVKLAGARAVVVQTRAEQGFVPSADLLLSALTPNTRGIVINSPGNPTCALLTEADARIVARGHVADNAPAGGHYLAPALVAGISPENRLARDEIFGPVQVVIPFDDEADALRIANGTDYGLVAGIWTADGARQLRLAKAIRSGQVFINNYGAGGGVELPFGGTGKSGHGREKGLEALYGFSVLKTVAAWHG